MAFLKHANITDITEIVPRFVFESGHGITQNIGGNIINTDDSEVKVVLGDEGSTVERYFERSAAQERYADTEEAASDRTVRNT